MPDVTEQGCFTRMALGGFSGAVLGGIYGSCISAWQQAPAVQMSRAQTLARTGGLLGRYGGLFGAVGAAHGMGSCFAEKSTLKNHTPDEHLTGPVLNAEVAAGA